MDTSSTLQAYRADDTALIGAPLTWKIIGCAMRVHETLGPGLLESIYRQALLYELRKAGLNAVAEVPLDVAYDGIKLDCGFRADVVVESKVVVELKAVDHVLPIHTAQLLTYMKIAGTPVGLLLNFNVVHLRHGIKRLVLSRR